MKTILITLLASLLILPLAAQARDSKDAAYTKWGNPVYDSQGDCVRTKWEEGIDPCAPPPPPQPVAQPAPPPPAQPNKELSNVYFEFDSAAITVKEQAELDQIVNMLRGTHKLISVKIIGYADEIGDVTYNDRLSEARAKNVEAYLATQGLRNPRSVDVRGLGELSSRGRCEHTKRKAERAACLWEDRRVELEFVYLK